MNLLIMGAPGAGKGSASSYIVDKYGLVHVSTGDMLRAAVKEKTPIGLEIAKYMNKAILVPDSIIHQMIIERFKEDDIKNGFLFDGYPRTLEQAIDLSEILNKLNMKLDGVINLDVEDEVLTKRIVGRRCCPDCGEIYNIYNLPPKKEGICDKCGATLYTRKDDNMDSLSTRLHEYHKNANPILAYYDSYGIVKHIKADQEFSKVFEDIKEALEGK